MLHPVYSVCTPNKLSFCHKYFKPFQNIRIKTLFEKSLFSTHSCEVYVFLITFGKIVLSQIQRLIILTCASAVYILAYMLGFATKLKYSHIKTPMKSPAAPSPQGSTLN